MESRAKRNPGKDWNACPAEAAYVRLGSQGRLFVCAPLLIFICFPPVAEPPFSAHLSPPRSPAVFYLFHSVPHHSVSLYAYPIYSCYTNIHISLLLLLSALVVIAKLMQTLMIISEPLRHKPSGILIYWISKPGTEAFSTDSTNKFCHKI